MGAFEPGYALFLEHAIQHPARAAVGVRHEQLFPAGRASLADPGADRFRDPLRPVVERRRQAGQVNGRHPGAARERDEFAGKGAAADDERGARPA